jgi:YtkA-like
LVAATLAVNLAMAPVLSGVQAQQKPPITVEWQVAATGKPLEREATITLTDAHGKPVENGQIEITVDMPSMPMTHRIPKIVARPTNERGQYTARFTLEMAGEWAAQIAVIRPQRTRVIKRFKVD